MKTSAAVCLLSAVAGVLAVPTEQIAREAKRPFFGGPFNKNRNGKSFNTESVQSPWGGGVQEGQGWRTVTGTTVIPSVTGQSPDAGAAAWVGIDGYSCQSAILQTGVVAWGDGRVQSWYEWYPEPPVYYGDQLAVKAGDEVRMSVNATSGTSGTSTLENLTTGQSVTTPYDNMGESLCGSDAEWIIEFGGGAQQFADFGEWDITGAAASGDSGQVDAQGSRITNVEIDGHVYTNCQADARGVECTWQ
ncbi:hypothetical protein JDV02_005645 [Purpureocillium takamizusanense]|uniref:Proteinase aspergillopepsin II n=1 Tax=Purpureocillium takamizusanense TaxID=2060973 RepID=A0A9Q8QGI1_9HYPO|nr:uncharacterized protein JDV02_005645 [Purpureocillium takamizusanense]UNI19463.1 hypothetical protein JDV02_005645 [Purpureocillium takamizusanense]